MTKRCLFKVVFSTILKDVLQTYFHFTEKILIKIFHCSSRFIWTVFSPFLTILNTRSISWRNNDEYTYASMHINIFEDCPFSILIFLLMNDNVYMSMHMNIFIFEWEKNRRSGDNLQSIFDQQCVFLNDFTLFWSRKRILQFCKEPKFKDIIELRNINNLLHFRKTLLKYISDVKLQANL